MLILKDVRQRLMLIALSDRSIWTVVQGRPLTLCPVQASSDAPSDSATRTEVSRKAVKGVDSDEHDRALHAVRVALCSWSRQTLFGFLGIPRRRVLYEAGLRVAQVSIPSVHPDIPVRVRRQLQHHQHTVNPILPSHPNQTATTTIQR